MKFPQNFLAEAGVLTAEARVLTAEAGGEMTGVCTALEKTTNAQAKAQYIHVNDNKANELV